jgi:hypothetical protein
MKKKNNKKNKKNKSKKRKTRRKTSLDRIEQDMIYHCITTTGLSYTNYSIQQHTDLPTVPTTV